MNMGQLKTYNFTSAIFFIVAVIGVVVSITSNTWVGVWVGMEMNMLGVLPMFMGAYSTVEVEASIKYYIVQVTGSLLLVLGIFMMGGTSLDTMCALYSPLLVVGIMIKLGMFPFHFWVPSVMSGISWMGASMLSTIQKVAPLMMCSFFMIDNASVMVLIGGINSIVGGIGGLNQTQFRPLMGYSSIVHSGWALAAMAAGWTPFVVYFLFYSIVVLSVFMIISYYKVTSFAPVTSMFNNRGFMSIFSILLLMLAGFPPFLVFFGKVFVMMGLVSTPELLIMLLSGSLVSLYYYLLIIYTWVTGRTSLSLYYSKFMMSSILIICMLLVIFSLLIFLV
uniref:NADH-ubiquinone oxidoreductase chain 2 n=1 Tax=Euciroa cf. queenslandica STW-2017 TaxID=1969321 RepID=A0A1U9XPF1_9BIVA|nr:NADH dehydrogenase subunit 2 [Euciroa cf. queenslandica STW-2017]AQZ26122.1 NADH dehydrogenase subunit 2 [Euciroa cf. queenslandica STW-2017]